MAELPGSRLDFEALIGELPDDDLIGFALEECFSPDERIASGHPQPAVDTVGGLIDQTVVYRPPHGTSSLFHTPTECGLIETFSVCIQPY